MPTWLWLPPVLKSRTVVQGDEGGIRPRYSSQNGVLDTFGSSGHSQRCDDVGIFVVPISQVGMRVKGQQLDQICEANRVPSPLCRK